MVVGISDGNFSPDHEEIEGQDYYVNFSGTYPYQNYYMHGNSVAITAAGATDNGIGKSSIGRDCKLAMVGLTYDMVLHLSQMNIPVVNMSWASSCSPSSYVQSVINEIHANGTTLVAAAGNGNTCGGATNLVYPAAYEHVIAVSSVGPYDNHLMWNTTHQHNASVDLVAPGFGVAISYGPNWYSWGSGTSYSAPFVTGTIGLMLSVNPCLTSEEIEYILKETAVNVDALNPQFAGQLGAGRLDSEAAVLMAQSYVCEQNGNGNGNGNGNDGNNSGGLGGNGNGNNGNTNGNPNNGNIDTEPINGNHYNVHGNGNNDEFGNGNNGHGNDPGNFDRSNPGNRAPAVQGELNQNDSPVINNFDAVLYPNPTASEVNIKWNIQQEMTLRLIDAKGMIIQEKEINAQTSRVSIELPSSGFYIAYLEKDGETVWKDRVTRK